MKIKASLKIMMSIVTCAVMVMAQPSLAEARSKHSKTAAKHSVKKLKTAKKATKHKSKKVASRRHKPGKKVKVAKRYSDRLPKGVVPPSRVRIIDTAGKGNPEAFPMPEMSEVRDVAASTKPTQNTEMEVPEPELMPDAFNELETQ